LSLVDDVDVLSQRFVRHRCLLVRQVFIVEQRET
jgi:hypothetical protein